MSVVKVKIHEYEIDVFDNDWVGSSIINQKEWEPHITFFLKRNLKSTSVFVDVGSNYGWHSIMSSKLCKTVYSFEPQNYMYEIQMKNIYQNNIKNITLLKYGIGNTNERLTMSPINYKENVNFGDLSIGIGGESIDVRTIDDLNLGRVDIIKIDVQGFEKFVLEGGAKSINEYKPLLIIELEDHQLRKFNYNVNDLFKFIKNQGYHIYLLDYHYPSDHICVHKDKITEFIEINKEWIKPLNKSNDLNHNLENGVDEKIIYSL